MSSTYIEVIKSLISIIIGVCLIFLNKRIGELAKKAWFRFYKIKVSKKPYIISMFILGLFLLLTGLLELYRAIR